MHVMGGGTVVHKMRLQSNSLATTTSLTFPVSGDTPRCAADGCVEDVSCDVHSNLSQLRDASLWRRRDAGEAGKVRFAAAHASDVQADGVQEPRRSRLSCRDLVTHCWDRCAPHRFVGLSAIEGSDS